MVVGSPVLSLLRRASLTKPKDDGGPVRCQAKGNRMAVQVSCVRGLAAKACGRGRVVCIQAGIPLQRRESPAAAVYRACLVSWYLRESGQRALPSSEPSAALFNLKKVLV